MLAYFSASKPIQTSTVAGECAGMGSFSPWTPASPHKIGEIYENIQDHKVKSMWSICWRPFDWYIHSGKKNELHLGDKTLWKRDMILLITYSNSDIFVVFVHLQKRGKGSKQCAEIWERKDAHASMSKFSERKIDQMFCKLGKETNYTNMAQSWAKIKEYFSGKERLVEVVIKKIRAKLIY